MILGEAPSAQDAEGYLKRILELPIAHGPRQVDKDLFLYGAGNLGVMALEFFSTVSVPVRGVVDLNPDSCRAEIKNNFKMNVLDVADIGKDIKENSLLGVCITTSKYQDIYEFLIKSGWTDVVPIYDVCEFYADRHPLGNGWFMGQEDGLSIDEFMSAMEIFRDSISIAHYLQFLAWRRSRVEITFNNLDINVANRFFIPEIINTIGGSEVFVDLGAHTGQVIEKFISIVGSNFSKIYAIEPDAANRKKLLDYRDADSRLHGDRMEVMSIALDDANGMRKFCDGFGYASQLSEYGSLIINCATFDSLNIRPTFLKLHLEGAELKVMKGARNTIKECRPIIVLTVYHNLDGLWSTPNWLRKNLVNYIFIFRNHGWCGTGAVIYCLPKERVESAVT